MVCVCDGVCVCVRVCVRVGGGDLEVAGRPVQQAGVQHVLDILPVCAASDLAAGGAVCHAIGPAKPTCCSVWPAVRQVAAMAAPLPWLPPDHRLDGVAVRDHGLLEPALLEQIVTDLLEHV